VGSPTQDSTQFARGTVEAALAAGNNLRGTNGGFSWPGPSDHNGTFVNPQSCQNFRSQRRRTRTPTSKTAITIRVVIIIMTNDNHSASP